MEVERLRLKVAWLSAIPFLVLARPTWSALLFGFAVGGLGVLLRSWAAGTIAKDERLATGGPYAHMRHPLYGGTLLVGVGLTVAGGHWIWPTLFVAFYASVYTRVMRRESVALLATFGEEYGAYAREVPALIPRVAPRRAGEADAGFALDRYLRNKEWETGLGFLLAWSLLLGKWWLGA